jgi:lipopolysaccharide/colanic/teichoic acid biosynthesis glycosyltransferase
MPTTVKSHLNSRTSSSRQIVDIALASISLFLLCPLLMAIAVAIRLQSPGPVLVRQSRTGLYVFRTTSGPNRRPTRLGSLLQQSRLYELPQLFSVIMGDHSLVSRPESEE